MPEAIFSTFADTRYLAKLGSIILISGSGYLLDIIYDGNHGTNFVLVYTILGVKVSGKNLQPVIMALLAGTADFIQEYDRALWPKLPDAQSPLIESIEVVVQDNAQPAAHTGTSSL